MEETCLARCPAAGPTALVTAYLKTLRTALEQRDFLHTAGEKAYAGQAAQDVVSPAGEKDLLDTYSWPLSSLRSAAPGWYGRLLRADQLYRLAVWRRRKGAETEAVNWFRRKPSRSEAVHRL